MPGAGVICSWTNGLVVEVCQLSNCQADDLGGGMAAASAPGGAVRRL